LSARGVRGADGPDSGAVAAGLISSTFSAGGARHGACLGSRGGLAVRSNRIHSARPVRSRVLPTPGVRAAPARGRTVPMPSAQGGLSKEMRRTRRLTIPLPDLSQKLLAADGELAAPPTQARLL